MRLKAIKLAGFKSFVDPTVINYVSNLTGVVGPNGCGKSNVIDAVRWVMGESSAKNLRGEALTDVIFSGSATRKPVGQATVDLLFDNVQGKLGGEYASYSEIAIKRQVTREGQSIYYLNNQRCRRKDITDIFLGTGLGPRSYAIIEQGMITRIILAKPEELRIFIEEAAGISKYKERRRETENRIRHTQDNVARLGDLKDELEKQLRHLERQSQAAAQYQELKCLEKKTSVELAMLAWQRLEGEIEINEAQIREISVRLAQQQANLQQLKTSQEKQKLLQIQVNEKLQEVQKRYYGVGSEISRIEQGIAHHEEKREQFKADKIESTQMLQTTQALLEKDQLSLKDLEEKLLVISPQQEESTQEAQQAQIILEEAEQTLEEWREKVAANTQAILIPTQLAEAEKAKITHLERQIQHLFDRIKRLDTESQTLQEEDPVALEKWEARKKDIAVSREECIKQLEYLQSQKKDQQIILEKWRAELKQYEQAWHETQGMLSALEALQASVLGKNVDARKQWLAKNGLEHSNVVELIQVRSGWENAVEMVLEGFLEAVGVKRGDIDRLSGNIASIIQEGIDLLEWDHYVVEDPLHERSLVHYIENKNNLPKVIYHLLQRVHVAKNITEAKALLTTLAPGESLITQEGQWLGEGWLRIKQSRGDNSGLLAREEKIKHLAREKEEATHAIDALQSSIAETQQLIAQQEAEKDRFQQEKNNWQQEMVAIESDYRIKQNKIEHVQKRREAIQRELRECQAILQESQREVNQARTQLDHALEKMASFTQEQEALAAQKARYHEAVLVSRTRVKTMADRVNALALQIQTYRTQVNALQLNIERFATQMASVTLKLSTVTHALEKIDEPIMTLKSDLETQLEKRLIIEEELSQARNSVANVDNETKDIEKRMGIEESAIESWREKNEHTKMQWQALSVHRENVLEKLKGLEVVLEEALKQLPQEANEAQWQERLQETERKIQHLGPINLAAIEEHEATLQRKEYLDAQLTDLAEALTTLETAIKKIDKETRAKFKETFDKVNEKFQILFPKLFGGGQASLSMTGEDLLDTGITLMARPPGKKNSTIQQLSGGEKALTAVALVFAIFELNPAPFCMLDEVDAPLDDNNVGRFCDLVKEMSNTVQFIYVSHNKLAIEMAKQLQGVTMREPGVSRLVTVDVEEAKSLVEA